MAVWCNARSLHCCCLLFEVKFYAPALLTGATIRKFAKSYWATNIREREREEDLLHCAPSSGMQVTATFFWTQITIGIHWQKNVFNFNAFSWFSSILNLSNCCGFRSKTSWALWNSGENCPIVVLWARVVLCSTNSICFPISSLWILEGKLSQVYTLIACWKSNYPWTLEQIFFAAPALCDKRWFLWSQKQGTPMMKNTLVKGTVNRNPGKVWAWNSKPPDPEVNPKFKELKP